MSELQRGLLTLEEAKEKGREKNGEPGFLNERVRMNTEDFILT
jgi:hypothetical protein